MREIKFRAKVKYNGNHKFNGEWIYGYYRNNDNGNAFITETLDEINNYIFEETEVEEETLGQYTGIKDKNGKEIYEGDIVKIRLYNNKYIIKWEQRISSFIIKDVSLLNEDIIKDLEVIGNVYDNPKLLEV